ncbi:hypothetical protein H072_7180 [Dactylellina haptotyla CBS 200.50]|uniref:Major facilitator superfamily (MFS) profile domain-containing protein n=1 Tax=Dactylellina haptotyla (strain CBS 200.50) TaxID=1284197 RepID=S8A7Q1_DACHA|nr:hypothetical protein H072_7180 [Dactylellina haptotyla CBS 200.50]
MSQEAEKEKQTEAGQDVEPPKETEGTPAEPHVQYSVFTPHQKWWIVALLAISAFFSPFSSTVYLPALQPVQQELGVTRTEVNLSLTTYLIFQAIAPTLTGELSDSLGRRPVFIITFIIYIAANVGLALQKSLPALLVLRMLQSTGSSGTVAIGMGTVADFTTSAERGSYMGVMNAFPLSSPALGPVIGGAIAETAGWRWIFWFLVIFSGLTLVLLILAFPETNRKVVGDGSINPPRLNRAIFENYVTPPLRRSTDGTGQYKRTVRDMIPNPFRSVLILFNKDVSIILFVMSVYYAAFYAVMASLPSLFKDIYGYNELQVGLCYLAFGAGAILVSLVNGKILDRDFQVVANNRGITVDRKNMADMSKFPLEAARLRSIWWAMSLVIAAIVPYGWCLSRRPHVAAPLILQFIIGGAMIAVVNSLSVFLVDLYPNAPATATASGNLMRCMFGAISTSVIDIMLTNLGVGWTFTFWGLICFICYPLLELERRRGHIWRQARFEALLKKQREEKECKEVSGEVLGGFSSVEYYMPAADLHPKLYSVLAVRRGRVELKCGWDMAELRGLLRLIDWIDELQFSVRKMETWSRTG